MEPVLSEGGDKEAMDPLLESNWQKNQNFGQYGNETYFYQCGNETNIWVKLAKEPVLVAI